MSLNGLPESLVIIGGHGGHLSRCEFCENDHFLSEGKQRCEYLLRWLQKCGISDYPNVSTELYRVYFYIQKLNILGVMGYCMHNAYWNSARMYM